MVVLMSIFIMLRVGLVLMPVLLWLQIISLFKHLLILLLLHPQAVWVGGQLNIVIIVELPLWAPLVELWLD